MFDAGSTPRSLWFDIDTVYHHVYYAEGYYEVNVNISNHLSWAMLTAGIVVATPVVNMMWLMPVPHASLSLMTTVYRVLCTVMCCTCTVLQCPYHTPRSV